MKDFDFKARFIAALPPTPPELDIHWDEFVEFDWKTVSKLDSRDAAFLIDQGLPRDASPFLSFEAYTPEQIQLRLDTFALPKHFFPIGHNGSGDILAIDTRTRAVIYLNHDADNLEVFINSTLAQFAECLCIYQEHLESKTMESCLSDIEAIDAAAAKPGAMWYFEVQAEIENG